MMVQPVSPAIDVSFSAQVFNTRSIKGAGPEIPNIHGRKTDELNEPA